MSLGLLSPPNPSLSVASLKKGNFIKSQYENAETQHLMHKVREEL
jgi:hypothetical protein